MEGMGLYLNIYTKDFKYVLKIIKKIIFFNT